jgi:oligoendopeptidase F
MLAAMDWDLSAYFTAPDGRDFLDFMDGLAAQGDRIQRGVAGLAAADDVAVDEWVALLVEWEGFLARMSHAGSFLGCRTAADCTDVAAARQESAFSEMRATAETIREAIIAALAHIAPEKLAELRGDDRLAGAGFFLLVLHRLAARRMDLPREALNAALSVNGIKAWGQLHLRLNSGLSFAMPAAGGDGVVRVPMAQRANLLTSADRATRDAAFHGGNEAWAQCEIVCERALNAIAGTRLTLDGERGVDHFLDNACDDARITRRTLDAMFAAIADAGPMLQGIAEFRSGLLGESHVHYRDLSAPAFVPPPDEPPLDWDEGCRLVGGAFDAAYPALGAFFQESLAAGWYDHSARPNKRPGGFCTTSQLIKESRIFMNYQADLGSVMTLAHEVGHAWHSRVLRDTRLFASGYPMTLAECASTFAEMILIEGVLKGEGFSLARKRALLDSDLRRALSFTLELPVRYHFEKRFYEERRRGFVPAQRLRELMVDEQRKSFGTALADDGTDPLFWASKQHFYFDAVMFYNFPYTFGYLLSQSLFARFRAEGAAFLADYERFLLASGGMSCEDLVRETLGESIEEPDFWSRALANLGRIRPRLEALS